MSILKIFSTRVYFSPNPESFGDLTYTEIVEVSINELSRINFWSNEPSTVNCFLKNVPSYISTLLKVASIIVDYQQDFFKYGKIKIKPLILEDIALESGFHESTISRITTKKTIQTPFGIIELRDLLSRSIKKNTQFTSSVCSVKQIIASIIENENKKEPFSDQEITDILEKQGYQIARRTVAKYREQLRIPTSINRKLT